MDTRRQVVVLHGGNVFEKEGEFWAWLFSHGLPQAFHYVSMWSRKNWKQSLQQELGERYLVLLPELPNPHNAKYAAWKNSFETLIPHLSDGVMLVGHSLGGLFLVKYLSENVFPHRVGALFLVAPAYEKDEERKIAHFTIPINFTLLHDQVKNMYLYYSKDDPVVDVSEFKKYVQALSLKSEQIRKFDDRGHFSQSSFPELVQDISVYT